LPKKKADLYFPNTSEKLFRVYITYYWR